MRLQRTEHGSLPADCMPASTRSPSATVHRQWAGSAGHGGMPDSTSVSAATVQSKLADNECPPTWCARLSLKLMCRLACQHTSQLDGCLLCLLQPHSTLHQDSLGFAEPGLLDAPMLSIAQWL